MKVDPEKDILKEIDSDGFQRRFYAFHEIPTGAGGWGKVKTYPIQRYRARG